MTDDLELEDVIGILASLSDDPIIITDRGEDRDDGPHVLWCNEAFMRRWSYSLDEILGRSPRYLSGPLTDPHTLIRLHRAMIQGKPFRGDLLGYDSAGTPHWVDLDVTPIQDRNERTRFFVCTQRDIAVRKQQELDLQAAHAHLRQTNEALKDIQERHELALRGAAVGLWDWNIRTNRVVWSDRARDILGFSAGVDPSGAAHTGQIHPGDRERVRAALRDHLDRRRPYDIAYRIFVQSEPAAMRWVRVRGEAIWGPDCRPLRMAGSLEDITEQQATRAREAEAADKLRLAMDAAQSGVWHYCRVTDTVILDQRCQEILGMPTQTSLTLANDALADRVHEEDRAFAATCLRPLIGGDQERLYCEYRVLSDDGRVIWLGINAQRSRLLPDGRTGRIVGTMRDLTAQKAIEASLSHAVEDARRAQQRLAMMADSVPGGLFELHFDRNRTPVFSFISQGMATVYGVPPAVLTENPRLMLGRLDHRDREAVLAALEDCRRHQSPWRQRCRLTTCRQGVRWIEIKAAPQQDADGLTTWYGHVSDVTDAVNREEELEAARRMAESANEAKNQFLANMSHEIRTPLNGVLGMAQLLEQSTLDSTQREAVQLIQESGTALLKVINDILEFAAIESGEVRVVTKAFDPRSLFHASAERWAQKAQAKGLKFSLDLEGVDNSPRLGDPVRLLQVLEHLVDNAIKFTAAGQVSARVSVSGDDKDRLCIVVSDTGIGIPETAIPGLFERFTQADGSLSRRHEGTGLGLAISRGLVDAMGGTIKVNSVVDEGTRVCVCVAVPLQATQDQTTSVIRSCEAGRIRRALRVLSVEDNALNRRVLAAMLQPLGVDLAFAENGREGVDQVIAHRFDLVLMDIQMPVMDGMQAFSAIRAWEVEHNRPQTPVVALTGNAGPEEVRAYLELGFDGCVPKPIQRDRLLEVLRRHGGAVTLARTTRTDGATPAAAETTVAAAETHPRMRAHVEVS